MKVALENAGRDNNNVQVRLDRMQNAISQVEERVTSHGEQIWTLNRIPSIQTLHATVHRYNSVIEELEIARRDIASLQESHSTLPATVDEDIVTKKIESLVIANVPSQAELDNKHTGYEQKLKKLFTIYGQLKSEIQQQSSSTQRSIDHVRAGPVGSPDHGSATYTSLGIEEDLNKLSAAYNAFAETTKHDTNMFNRRLGHLKNSHRSQFDYITTRLQLLEVAVPYLDTQDAASETNITPPANDADVKELKSLVQSQEHEIDVLRTQQQQDRADTQKNLRAFAKELSTFRSMMQGSQMNVNGAEKGVPANRPTIQAPQAAAHKADWLPGSSTSRKEQQAKQVCSAPMKIRFYKKLIVLPKQCKLERLMDDVVDRYGTGTGR